MNKSTAKVSTLNRAVAQTPKEESLHMIIDDLLDIAAAITEKVDSINESLNGQVPDKTDEPMPSTVKAKLFRLRTYLNNINVVAHEVQESI